MAYLYTPLHNAAISGDLDMARKFMESGEDDVNMRALGYNYPRTALHLACTYGHIDSVATHPLTFNFNKHM